MFLPKYKGKEIVAFITLILMLVGVVNLFRAKTINPKTSAEFAKVTVMITRYDGRSGGTGVIISSEKDQSKVLTNAHVCGLLKSGGLVRTDTQKGVVKSYQVSNIHDLCLVTVNTNFHVNTVLAPSEPDVYEDAIVSGHPHLLPVIVTRGIFSQKELINIMINVRPCTPDEAINDRTAIYCNLLGGIPIVRSFEAQVVSATIMPGSSGSAVFNKEGEISGLVFAGSGDFGYALVVPYEYINGFFEHELPTLQVNYPVNEAPIIDLSKKTNWSKICSGDTDENLQKICDLISKSLLLMN